MESFFQFSVIFCLAETALGKYPELTTGRAKAVWTVFRTLHAGIGASSSLAFSTLVGEDDACLGSVAFSSSLDLDEL